MRAVLRHALPLVVLATLIPGSTRAQTVCDQLLPIGIVAPETGFQIGCATLYVLRYAPFGSAPPYYAWLAYPPCANGPCAGLTGGLLFVCAAASGYSCCVSAPGTIPLPAGIYAGQLRAGLDQRFASDTDTLPGICFSDYRGNGARVVNVPLILPAGNGITQVQVVGFERMFLVSRPGSVNVPLQVEFVAEPTPTWNPTWGRTKIRYR